MIYLHGEPYSGEAGGAFHEVPLDTEHLIFQKHRVRLFICLFFFVRRSELPPGKVIRQHWLQRDGPLRVQ